jgi:hypothetical protein
MRHEEKRKALPMHAHARTIRVTLALLLAVPAAARAQWQLLDPPTTADLRGIDNVGGGVAWASGTDGTVVRTEDGGYMWQHCSTPPGAEKLDFRGIQAFDENTAIVMSSGPGDQSRLYKTTDGCQSWHLVLANTDPKGFWDTVQFQKGDFGFIGSKGCGVLVGDPVAGAFQVRVALDLLDQHLGEAWLNEEPAHYPAASGEAAFAASNSSAIIFGSRRFLIATGGKEGAHVLIAPLLNGGTGGDAAKTYPVPMAHGSDSAGIFSIADKDLKMIVAVGGDYLKPDAPNGTAAFTTDGGRHWQPAQTPRLPLRRSLRRRPQNLDHRRPQRH